MTVRRRRLRAFLFALILAAAFVPAPAGAVTQEELHRQLLSVTVGPSPYGWNLVGVRKDVYRDPTATFFVTAGVGPILAGAGAAFHPNGRDADGFVISGVAGILGVHGGGAYQWKVNPTDFIHFGLHVGSLWHWDLHVLPIVAWEHRL